MDSSVPTGPGLMQHMLDLAWCCGCWVHGPDLTCVPVPHPFFNLWGQMFDTAALKRLKSISQLQKYLKHEILRACPFLSFPLKELAILL